MKTKTKKTKKSLYVITHETYEKIYKILDQYEKDVRAFKPKGRLLVNIELVK